MKLYKYDEKTMQYIKCSLFESNIKTTIIIALISSFVSSVLVTSIEIYNKKELKKELLKKEIELTLLKKELSLVNALNKAEEALETSKKEVNDFSEENLLSFMKQIKLKHSDIAFSQAVLETSNFKSKIFLYNNNLFGMKEAKVRGTVNKGTNRGHAKYDNWRESVIDYLLWQQNYANFDDEKEYIKKIDEVYAEDSNYIKKVNHIKNETNKRRKNFKSSIVFSFLKDKSSNRLVYTLRHRFNRFNSA